MKNLNRNIKQLITTFILLLVFGSVAIAQNKKVLVIGVDGLINSVIDYASTPSIDELKGNATYNMNGFGGSPSYSSTGWSTLLTGVSPTKHGVFTDNSLNGNHFDVYPSIVDRLKETKPTIKVASIVRDAYINNDLNSAADYKFAYNSDTEVLQKAVELLGQQDLEVGFVQFNSPREAGENVGYLLREAEYVLAVQKIDEYVGDILNAIKARASYDTEVWSIFLVSTHGGSPTGVYTGSTLEEINVPMILSGNSIDNKLYDASSMDAIKGADNSLGIIRHDSGEKTYVRVPIDGTELQGMDKFTIEMWIKAGSDNSSDPSIMGDKDWDSGSNPGFIICRSGSSWKINIANQKRDRIDVGKTGTIEDGRWHHIAVTFDKTKECIVYQDGEQIAYKALTYKETDDMASPFNYLCLAQDGTEAYPHGGPNWSGSYNEVRIWTDVLPHDVINSYMNLKDIENTNHPNLASLNLYLKMDEIKGTVITDYSGKGNHGELVGPGVYRNPYYSLKLTDVYMNIFSQLNLNVNEDWGVEGNALKAGVPYRLFKVNR